VTENGYGIFSFLMSKELKLLRCIGMIGRFGPIEDFHAAKLLVSYRKDTDMPFFREHPFYPPDMDIGVFTTGTMPYVYGKLEHGKTVAHNLLPEPCGNFPVLFPDYGQIKENEDPQNTIFIKTGRSDFQSAHDPLD